MNTTLFLTIIALMISSSITISEYVSKRRFLATFPNDAKYFGAKYFIGYFIGSFLVTGILCSLFMWALSFIR